MSTTTLRQATGQKAPLKIEPRPEVHQAQDGSETPNRTDESDARGQGGPAEADAREETNESEGDRHALSVVIKTEPHSKVTEREAEACESLAIGKSPDRDTEGRTELFNQEAGHWRRTTRSAIPNATLRQLFAQAKHQCERCGARGGRMQVHHTQPVSEGGDNGPERLKVLCEPCHGFVHEADFAHKPGWRQGREAAMSRAALRRR